jgi:hypothetical protein
MSATVILPALPDDYVCARNLIPFLYPYDVIIDCTIGLANAIKSGIDKANVGNIVVMDSDFQHPYQVVPGMIALLDHYDLVCCSRSTRTSNAQGVLSYLGNQLIRRILHLPVSDCTSGFFACNRDMLLKLPESVWEGYGDYYIELLMHAKKLNWTIIEIRVDYNSRMSGKGHTKVGVESKRYLKRLWKCLTI